MTQIPREAICLATTGDGRKFEAALFHGGESDRWGALLLPALWGLDIAAMNLVTHLVDIGATVLAPDRFWRYSPGVLDRNDPRQEQLAHQRMAAFPVAQGIDDTKLACDSLRELTSPRLPVCVFGFCFGGRYAFEMAAQGKVDAAFSYHGNSVHEHISAADRVRVPVQLHYGGADPVVPMSEVALVQDGIRSNPLIELFVYPQINHGFMVPETRNYDAAAARLAWSRTHRIIDLLKTPSTAGSPAQGAHLS